MMEKTFPIICKRNPLVTPEDEPSCELIARELCAANGNADYLNALQYAVEVMQGFRAYCREPAARAAADALPVRKAAPAGDGGGRYYWRVALANDVTVSAVKNEDKYKGTIQDAKRKAVELFKLGSKPVELIPPDFDPQQQPDEWTKNVSKLQPDGLTVRQRTKKV